TCTAVLIDESLGGPSIDPVPPFEGSEAHLAEFQAGGAETLGFHVSWGYPIRRLPWFRSHPTFSRSRMYDWLVAAVLGTVQALTEFLPTPSSAHVRIVGELMLAGNDPAAFFNGIIQIGSDAAVVADLGRDIAT